MTCYHEEGSPPEKNGDLDAVGGGGGGGCSASSSDGIAFKW